MKRKNRRSGSASLEVIMSVAVFMAITMAAFWMSAKVYAVIYGMNAASSGAGISSLSLF